MRNSIRALVLPHFQQDDQRSETVVSLGYDEANRQIWEEQTVAGFPTRRVETPRDDDGFREPMNASGGYGLRYDYRKRGQLRTIFDGDAAGVSQYDALNRP